MTLKELLEKTDVLQVSADLDAGINGVSYDSRTIRTGEVFVAIKGFQDDGRRYIEDAVGKGAACIICEDAPGAAAPYVLVENSRKALATVSASWFGYPASGLKLVGVTGTNGKTTVTSLTKQIIEKCTGAKAGLIGTNQNMIGDKEFHAERTTPESYEIQKLLKAMCDEGCEYAVIEVSSHALQLYRVYGLEFEAGVFTNLSPDHLDFHASMDEYAKVKSRLFSHCRQAAINIDDEYASIITDGAACPVKTYSLKNDAADLVGKGIRLRTDSVEFYALTTGRLTKTMLMIPGIFSVYNALAAMSAAMLLGIGTERSAAVMPMCEGVKGRAEVVPTGGDFTVLIDYAHTPDALKNIIRATRGFTQNRVVTLFGCGGDRDKTKRPLMGEIAAELSDFVVVTTDNPRSEEPGAIISDILTGLEGVKTPYMVIENRREAIHWALGNAGPGDVLLLVGKGHETYQIFGSEKRHFDEREVVAEYYSAKGQHLMG